MSHENLKRRDFIKGAATAGLSAPLLAGESFAEVSQQNQAPALGRARPVVIASANGANAPKGGVEPRGVSCVERAMQMLKSGGDTLEAVVAGVNIVEDDPDDTSVGYGGLPNEECEVELDASVMHGPSRRAGAVASLRYIKNPSSVAKLVLERTDHILLVAEGALRADFARRHQLLRRQQEGRIRRGHIIERSEVRRARRSRSEAHGMRLSLPKMRKNAPPIVAKQLGWR